MKKDLLHILNEQDWQEFIECGSILRVEANQYQIGWGERTWFKKPEVSSNPFFYFPDFFLLNESLWFQHEKTALVGIKDLLSFVSVQRSPLNLLWNNPYQEYFKRAFEDLKRLFSGNKLQKAVPYVFEEAEMSINPMNLRIMLNQILQFSQPHSLYVYGFWDKNEGMLGATPELLFKYANDEIIDTVALAGTKKNSEKHTLINDAKENIEHQMVVDGILHALSTFGRVIKGELQILQLPKLSHLYTPIQVKGHKKPDFLSLVEALHPTPALGTFPRNEGWDWLESYEQKIPRWRFGAPVGLIHGTSAKCFVGIRNVQWKNERIRIGAGCGVVKESSSEKEWQELQLKLSSIKEMMCL